jgi:hypothetical protein
VDIDRKTTKAVKRYIHELPPVLKDRYGGTGYAGYTAGQIETTVSKLGLSAEHLPLAVVMFGEEGALAPVAGSDAAAERLVRILDKISQSGFADATGFEPATWLSRLVADSLTGDDAGEIGAEGGVD